MFPSIVLVEDQPIAREMILELLDGHVRVVAAAEGPHDAIEAVRVHRPTGALIDVNLGSTNGFHLAKELSKGISGSEDRLNERERGACLRGARLRHTEYALRG